MISTPELSPTVSLGVADYLRGVSDEMLERCSGAGVPAETSAAALTEQLRRQQKPKRIQRKRSKGWTMPAGCVYVGRPTRWGNPYSLKYLLGAHGDIYNEETGLTRILAAFEAWAHEMLAKHPDWLEPLKGKDLCCWCREGRRCHADILIKLAN